MIDRNASRMSQRRRDRHHTFARAAVLAAVAGVAGVADHVMAASVTWTGGNGGDNEIALCVRDAAGCSAGDRDLRVGDGSLGADFHDATTNRALSCNGG